jgi:hypothetical protein
MFLCNSLIESKTPSVPHLTRVAASGCDLRRRDRSLPSLKGEGANLRHLALQIEHRGCDTGSGALPCFSKPYPRKVWRVTGIVRGAKRLKGESGSVAQAQRSERKTRRSASQLCAVGRTSSPAPGRAERRGACDRMRDVIAHLLWQNLGAALHTGVFISNEPPKVCEGDGLMSQRPIDIADSGFVRFRIENDDLLETIWYVRFLN